MNPTRRSRLSGILAFFALPFATRKRSPPGDAALLAEMLRPAPLRVHVLNQQTPTEKAAALGRRLAGETPERRLEALASHIADVPATFSWSTNERPGYVVGRATAGKHEWALASKQGEPAKEHTLFLMELSLVHEATKCPCRGSDAPCPAYRAFEQAIRAAA